MKPIWFTGNTRSGKSWAARSLRHHFTPPAIVLDGDEMRKIWPGLGFSEADRWTQNLRIARLAKLLSDQGIQVIVAAICPYQRLRKEVKRICSCDFRFLEGGQKPNQQYPYEPKGADE
jgi:adenylylsulfate kinase-like enzyme